MSKFEAFLKPITTEMTEDVVVSDRFRDEKGEPAKIKIRAITQQENNLLIKRSTERKKDKGQIIETWNKPKYQAMLVGACVVEPDFSKKELLTAYKTEDPLEVPGKMLFAGEYAKLIEKIMDINGFKDDEELEDEAKN